MTKLFWVSSDGVGVALTPTTLVVGGKEYSRSDTVPEPPDSPLAWAGGLPADAWVAQEVEWLRKRGVVFDEDATRTIRRFIDGE